MSSEKAPDEDSKLRITPEAPRYYGSHSKNTSNSTKNYPHHSHTSSSSPVTPGHFTRTAVVPGFGDSMPTPTNLPPQSTPLSNKSNDITMTTHNDPSLRVLLQKESLRGSTRFLHQFEQQKQQKLLRRLEQPPPMSTGGGDEGTGHKRRWSSGDVFPLDTTPLLETTSVQDNTTTVDDQLLLLAASGFPMLPPFPTGRAAGEATATATTYTTTNATTMMTEGELAFHRNPRNNSIGASVRGIVNHITSKGFLQDARSLAEGTIPQSIVLSFFIGIVCGVASYLYYTALFFLLDLFWTTIPETYIVPSPFWKEEYYWVYAPCVTFFFALLVGLSVVLLGEPGDLPFTIACIHKQAYIPMNHTIPMFCASLFSILAGGSLGPEAPLVAICGALGGFVSRRIFRQNHIHVVRKHTLMGMAGALSAFFGCPLGGSLFALEVNSRFGIEYYEHMVEAIFAGEITLVVFRSLSGLPIAPIWNLTQDNGGHHMEESAPWMVVAGGCIGLLGAGMAYVFAVFHWAQMGLFDKLGLLDNSKAVYRALLGSIVISGVGLLVPHTMFWGEEEFQVVSSMSPTSKLPFMWPTGGLIGFENDSPYKSLIIGLAKIVTISYTVASGKYTDHTYIA